MFDFGQVRSMFHGKKMSMEQVDGMKFILGGLQEWPIPHQAYALATVFHETAQTMLPITEYGPRSYFNKYEPSTKIGHSLGNVKMGDGFTYRGRGYVMITGLSNYQKFGIADEPEKALELTTALQILKKGMAHGMFTGHKLADYDHDGEYNYVEARRIINGLDRAKLIAGYAGEFEDALMGRNDHG